MNIIFDVFPHYFDRKTFAQCTSCFSPMIGILDTKLRSDCHGCIVIAREMYGVDECKCL
jgi:hypothetical protein